MFMKEMTNKGYQIDLLGAEAAEDEFACSIFNHRFNNTLATGRCDIDTPISYIRLSIAL
jgi:N-acetyl-anhydromuramyl-L-alanine amidase AmpD